MQDVESIEALQRQLVVYRRTIEFLEIQRAQFGAFTPPYIWHQFDETRTEIARIKHELREQGIEVGEHNSDAAAPAPTSQPAPAAPAPDSAALLRAYLHMLLDQMRYLGLAGLSEWRDQYRQLADLFVDCTLTPLAMPSTRDAGDQLAIPTGTFARASEPAARLLIEGEPGSGKTTSLHALALACAALALGDRSAGRLVDAWPAAAPLPIALSGHDIATALAHTNAAPNEQSMPTLSAFWGAIEAWLQYSNLSDLVPTIQQMLENGDCIVLIDDIDTLPRGTSEYAFMAALGRFVARYPLNRYVITCTAFRPVAMAPLASFARYALAPPSQSQAGTIIQRWYASVADRAGMLMDENIAQRVMELQALLFGDERLHAFTRTPLTLALSALVHAEGYALPANRNIILQRLADLLLSGQRSSAHGAARQVGQALGFTHNLTLAQRLALIEPLALAFQSQVQRNPDHVPSITVAEVEALIGSEMRKHQSHPQSTAPACQSLLDWCCEHSLLMQTSGGAYIMPNAQLREYLAGRALASLADFPTRAYERRNAPYWYETFFHAVNELERRNSPHIARLFIRLLLHPPDAGELPNSRDTMLAGACLLEMRERSWPNRALRGEVRERLFGCISNPELTVAERVKAGLLLGQLGDPRLAHLMPPLATVPGGDFILGTADGYDDERPVQQTAVATFAIGIYPVTNEEYARFLAASPLHAPPPHWHDPRYNNPACPVVSVSWHEATAYCAWLTRRLHAEGLLPEDQVVRLPLEQEWEKAACWDAKLQVKRRFPWGNSWASSYANTSEARGTWMTSPVGCYPESVSPYGLHDCVGNVWEWTASEYASYPGAPRTFQEQGIYTLRGSSHATNPTHARCTYRSRLPATSWRSHLGFRIVVGTPLAAA